MCILYSTQQEKIHANCVYLERISKMCLSNWIFDEGYGSLINSKEEDISLS